jgi:hypothetical protein
MTLAINFDEWEHLQSTLMNAHNRLVREEFSDVGGDNWEPSITGSRASMRVAATIHKNDTAPMVACRLFFYYFTLRKTQDLQPMVYSYPVEDTQAVRKFRPQIVLFFQEDEDEVEDGFMPLRARISYRLMNENSTSITQTELTSFANRIKTKFGANNGYIWRKGKDMATYKDVENGYDFQLLVRSKADAKELISKVLDTNQDTPDWKHLQYKENDEPTSAYPTLPPNQVILGDAIREPRRRPIGAVRFLYAYCDIWGRGKPVILYDRSFRYPNVLVRDLL